MAGQAKENLPGGSLKYQFVYLNIGIFRRSYHKNLQDTSILPSRCHLATSSLVRHFRQLQDSTDRLLGFPLPPWWGTWVSSCMSTWVKSIPRCWVVCSDLQTTLTSSAYLRNSKHRMMVRISDWNTINHWYSNQIFHQNFRSIFLA